MTRALLIAALLMFVGGSADAEPTAADPLEDRVVTPEREAAAQKFAQLHHPELATLLESLKRMDVKQYEVAIQELFRTSERLAKVQSKTPDRYEHDLAIWKLDSRIRLLAAQSLSGMPEARRQELKQLLLDRQQVKIKQLEQDRAKLAARLEKLDESIGDLKKQQDVQAEKEVERLLKSVKAQSNSKSK